MQGITVGDKTSKFPIIQGGMGVGVSMHKLAGTVAKEGGIGIISAADIGYQEEDFNTNPLEANLRAIGKEITKAREIAGESGIVGINIMVALSDYAEIVKESVKQKVDLIISGAGLPKDWRFQSNKARLRQLCRWNDSKNRCRMKSWQHQNVRYHVPP